tara:strand:+ start:172 stop:1344 length:1173 start_codon:yes stop_codon:yes gene_type:complete
VGLKLASNKKKNEFTILKLKNINQSNNFNLNGVNKVNFNLTYNKKTGDLFLKNPTNHKNLISPHRWLKYNEPENHIKKITKVYEKYFARKKNFVLGITYKDQSFINCINNKIVSKKYIIDPSKDLKLKKNKGIELIQDKLTKIKSISKIKSHKPNLIIVRHIWEHFYNQKKFINFLKSISNEETIIYFEIPDCEKSIINLDYSMLWEEHIHYYSEKTFLRSIEKFNFEVIKNGRFKYPYEDVLYAFFKLKKNKITSSTKVSKDVRNIIKYGKNFNNIKENLTRKLNLISNSGKVGVIGASHMANSVISFFDLDKYISDIYDGNKHKIGKYYFNNRIKIYDIEKILINNCKNFIIAINPMHKKFIKSIKSKLNKNNKNVFLLFSKKFYLYK